MHEAQREWRLKTRLSCDHRTRRAQRRSADDKGLTTQTLAVFAPLHADQHDDGCAISLPAHREGDGAGR